MSLKMVRNLKLLKKKLKIDPNGGFLPFDIKTKSIVMILIERITLSFGLFIIGKNTRKINAKEDKTQIKNKLMFV